MNESDLSEKLGAVVRILLRTPMKKFQIGALEAQIWPAIRLGQCEIIYDEKYSPVAYASWAFLTDDVARELRMGSQRLLHFSEWNEGLVLHIIDFIAPSGHCWELASRLKRGGLSKYAYISAARCYESSSVSRSVFIQRAPNLPMRLEGHGV